VCNVVEKRIGATARHGALGEDHMPAPVSHPGNLKSESTNGFHSVLPWSSGSPQSQQKGSRWVTRSSFNLGDIDAIGRRKAFPPFASLKAFEMIGRLGSIRKAALALGVDHAGVSRHLRALEQWAGIPLVDRRRGQNGRLTPEGMRYHARISAAFVEIDNAGEDLIQKGDLGRLHVWCSPGFACKWLLQHLDEFSTAHADMDIDLRPTDFGPDFARAEAAADIRFVGDWLPKSVCHGVETVELIRPIIIPVASPAFLASARNIGEPEDILHLPLLHEEDEEQWRTWLAYQGMPLNGYIRGTRLWHAHLTIDAAKRGQGVALANHFLVADEIRNGDLVEVLAAGKPYRRTGIGSYVLAAREDRWRTSTIATFRHWLQSTMRREIAGSSIV
jgi:DNA-binding transcriptional LysR family regulator